LNQDHFHQRLRAVADREADLQQTRTILPVPFLLTIREALLQEAVAIFLPTILFTVPIEYLSSHRFACTI
jgi:hypothetical protein